MSRPLSALTSVVDCISTALRDVWSDSAAHLFAISPPLACRNISSLYVRQILVHDAPTGTNCAGRAVGMCEYAVEFTDRSSENFVNVIAECMYAQIDSEGNQYQLLSEITDHRSNQSAIQIADGFTTSRNGNRVPKSTTRGWSLLVSWKDGSSDWLPLKDLKDSYPIQIAEYAMANKIVNEPVFNWWVDTVLRKRNYIVAKVKRYWQMTHKFGIRLPKTVAEALAIDDQTGTDFWWKALGKEMNTVKVHWTAADRVSPEQAQIGKESSMIGYQEIRCHVIFDVKMDFTRKARFVASGHTTDTPRSIPCRLARQCATGIPHCRIK